MGNPKGRSARARIPSTAPKCTYTPVVGSVFAVVPTFRPDSGELVALVTSLLAEGVPVLIADDASPATFDPVLRQAAGLGAVVERHERNEGVARSLNSGLRRAAEHGATWLLTVDQDSGLPDDYVHRMLEQVAELSALLAPRQLGAVAAGSIDDASGRLSYPITFVGGVPSTEEVIQTGTLWRVDALLRVGGFDETLGIDAVDAAACLRLREQGLVIGIADRVRVQHRVGDGRQVYVLGRFVLASGHPPHRRTTIVRNRLRLFPAEFAQSPIHALRTLRRVAVNTTLAVTVEEDRWAKAKGSARGLLPAKRR
jgi:rhamnosyltransferase